ncbi:MAG: hypothetical protein RSA10_03230 [Bacilli bacterium]
MSSKRFPIIVKKLVDGKLQEEFVYLRVEETSEVRDKIKRENYINKYCNINLSEFAKGLCFTCKNASPEKCEKIEDLSKKIITDYSFIKDGFQIQDPYYSDLDEDGEIENDYEVACRHNSLKIVKFKVNGCNNYKSDRGKNGCKRK